jgi:hypothetical protein
MELSPSGEAMNCAAERDGENKENEEYENEDDDETGDSG